MSCERKLKIHLHGYLKDIAPDGLELSGSTVIEVINGLCRQSPALQGKAGQDKHHIQAVGFDTRESLFLPIANDITELHLVPAINYGKGGFFQIILGIALIVASFYFPPLMGSISFMGQCWGISTLASAAALSLGKMLIIGGLLELLSPSPKTTDNSGSTSAGSKYLGANQNTTAIGTRIPFGYGRAMIGGQYLDFNVDAVDIGTPLPVSTTYPFTFTDGGSQVGGSSPWTFSSSIGNPQSDRYVYIAVFAPSADIINTDAVSGVTIGGIAATRVAAVNTADSFHQMAIYGANVPDGSTASVVVSTTGARAGIYISVGTAYGLTNPLVPTATVSDLTLSSFTLSATISAPARGIVFGVIGDPYYTHAGINWGGITTSGHDVGISGTEYKLRSAAKNFSSAGGVTVSAEMTLPLSASIPEDQILLVVSLD